MKKMLGAFSVLAAALSAPALAGPVNPARPELPFFAWEQARYGHHHRHSARDAEAASDPEQMFWPLRGMGGIADGDPACALYGCGRRWPLGPFAWGLYGLGLSDPLGVYQAVGGDGGARRP